MRYGGKFLCAGLLSLAVSLSASALDAVDIGQMLSNGVQESVIVNMVQSQKLAKPLQAGEIIELKNAGASNTLLEVLTNPDNVLVAAAPQVVERTSVLEARDPGPIVVQSTSSPVVVESTPAPIVVESTPIVVESPPVIYTRPYGYPGAYYGWPYRYGPYWGGGYSANFYFGGGPRWGGPPPPPRWGPGPRPGPGPGPGPGMRPGPIGPRGYGGPPRRR